MSATSPDHYRNHPAGMECIDITRYLPCPIANVIKYLWRWDRKGGAQDLEKALVYLGWIDPTAVKLLRAIPRTTPTRDNIHTASLNLRRHYDPPARHQGETVAGTGRLGEPLYTFLRWVDSQGSDWAFFYAARDLITQKITDLQGERA